MGMYGGLSNKHFICELEESLGENVILFTIDGYAYYGRLIQIIDCCMAVLVAGTGQTSVLVRFPDQTFYPQGNSCIPEDQTYIDICTIIAKNCNLTEVPDNFC